jgi:hypothetical protein
VDKPPAFARRPAPAHRGPVPVSSLHTTCEGIWLVQALCGIEMLPANLLLRPWVAEGGRPTGHPGVPVLRKAGVLIGDETVHPTIADWIETLAAPDIELAVCVRRGQDHLRVVIARRADTHVAASRCGDDVTIEELRGVGDVRELVARILPMCGTDVDPAGFDPISVASETFIDRLAEMTRGTKRPFAGLGLSAEQRRMILLATDNPVMEASFAVVLHDRRGAHVGLVSASITDTEQGRVVAGPVRSEDGTWFTQIVPGTPAAAARAVAAVVSSMGVTWHGHARH